MNPHFHYAVNIGLCWFIVFLAIGGYFLTLRRMGQKWPFWVILIAGWGFLAVSNTLVALGIAGGTPYISAVWMSSYVLILASLVLLFFRLIRVMKIRE
jgi:hypothetical protein